MFSVIHSDGSGDDASDLQALSDGRAVLEHLGRGGERQLFPVSEDRVLELWGRRIDGDIDGLLAEPWTPGYGARAT